MESIMRRTVLTLSLLAAPLAAQNPQPIKVEKDPDPTTRVQAGTLPAGWSVRLDDKDTTRYSANDTRFVTMGPGFHVTSGPAALYFNPANQASGNYTVSTSFRQMKAPTHPEAYGLFLGGQNLTAANQEYLYFLVRGDGKYFVAHRAGAEVHRVVPWTENAAINKQDAAGVASNNVAAQVTADSLHLMVNGTRVQSFARSAMPGFRLDGQTGLRVNHNLDVHIGSFEVKRD
jgi:hypothetical protein